MILIICIHILYDIYIYIHIHTHSHTCIYANSLRSLENTIIEFARVRFDNRNTNNMSTTGFAWTIVSWIMLINILLISFRLYILIMNSLLNWYNEIKLFKKDKFRSNYSCVTIYTCVVFFNDNDELSCRTLRARFTYHEEFNSV